MRAIPVKKGGWCMKITVGRLGASSRRAASQARRSAHRRPPVSPGTKANFYFSFLDRVAPLFAQEAKADDLGECRECGAPTPADVCAFCRLVEKATRVSIR